MTKFIKKPLSILLSLLMVLSVLAVVPFTASAAKITSSVDISELQPGDVVDSYTSISNNNGYTVKIPSGQARQWGNASGVIIDHDVELTNYSFRGSSISNRSGDYCYFVPVDGDGQGPYFAIKSVDHNAKVVTVYSPVVYTIKWLNYDNRVLASKKYLEGEMPTYTGSTPNKPANAQYAYTFTGWSEEITAATCNKNYIAQFSASPLPEDYPAPNMGSIYVGNSRATALGEISGTGATSGTVTLSQEGDYNVLTFNNFVLEGRGNSYTISGGSFYTAPISYYGTSPMIIRLIGENRITHTDSTDGNENCCGFYFSSAKETIIEGEGSLSVFSGNSKRGSVGMYLEDSNLILSKCTLNVRGGTTSSTYSSTVGISTGAGDCRIEDGASLTVSSGENNNSYGINVSSYGNVVVKSGSFSATGTKSALFYYGDADHTNIVTDSGSTFKVTKAGDTAADAVDVEPGEFINKKYVYAEAGIFHTVTWKNGDTTLRTDTVNKDAFPAYTGETPVKAEDEQYTYTFSGWSDGTNTYGATDTLPAVTGDITYTATFEATDLFVINDGVLTAYNGDKSALTTLTIPDEVTEISGAVFKNCTNLESVNLNNVVKVTGESFFGCSKLSSVIGTKLKYAGYRSFCTTTASLRTLTMRSGNNGADKKGLDSAFIVQAMVDAGQPTWYFYTVVRKGNDGNDFHYTAFNQTFLVEEGVEPFIESDYEAEQTASSGVNKSAIIYIKIDDENHTIKVKSNESNVSGYGPGTKILIDGVQYTIVEETGINYDGEHTLNPSDKVTVSGEDKGKENFGLDLDEYFNMQMLGVQLKNSIATEGGEDGIRFVTAVNSKLLKGNKIADYGYIVVKAKQDDTSFIYNNMNKLTYDKVDEKNRFSCYGSSNTISGEFGQYASDTDYKYVTLAITGTEASADTVAARFYVKTTDGEYHYADYIDGNNATHGGMAFNIADVLGNLK